MPQSVDPATSRLHQPPRISVESIPPYLLGPVATLQRSSLDPQGCSCDLTLTVPVVRDDDPLARLEVRWFLDYDPAKPSSQRLAAPATFIDGSFDSTAVERPGPSFVFNLAALGITADGPHVVDLVIAESGGFELASKTLPFRAMNPGYESTGYRFFVDVVTNNNARCPIVPPSTLNCAGSGP